MLKRNIQRVCDDKLRVVLCLSEVYVNAYHAIGMHI
jgi:hypothetical protein